MIDTYDGPSFENRLHNVCLKYLLSLTLLFGTSLCQNADYESDSTVHFEGFLYDLPQEVQQLL